MNEDATLTKIPTRIVVDIPKGTTVDRYLRVQSWRNRHRTWWRAMQDAAMQEDDPSNVRRIIDEAFLLLKRLPDTCQDQVGLQKALLIKSLSTPSLAQKTALYEKQQKLLFAADVNEVQV